MGELAPSIYGHGKTLAAKAPHADRISILDRRLSAFFRVLKPILMDAS